MCGWVVSFKLQFDLEEDAAEAFTGVLLQHGLTQVG